MIILVSDFFSDQVTGGAELTTDAFVEDAISPPICINSQQITAEIVNAYKHKRWIFGNFSQISDSLLLDIIKKVQDYSVIEYDYKYCSYRSTHKHVEAEGKCECHNTSHGKLVSIFLRKAKNVFWMSEGQKKEYQKAFPFLAEANNTVLNSSFTNDTLKFIKSLDITEKDEKYIILKSDSWIKGTDDCVKYAEDNNLEYELVSGLQHKDLLRKLAKSKGLIFFPKGLDTCPRITMEAKMLGCDLILNDYVQHKGEEWFDGDIEKHILQSRKIFFEKCLKIKYTKEKYKEDIKFHFIVPCYNAEEWVDKTIKSIKSQTNSNFTATIIDDISSDNTYDRAITAASGDERFTIIKNTEKKYALKNIADAIDAAHPDNEDVIIVLDGDDWMPSDDVLNYLTKVYKDEDILLTYGSYEDFPHGNRGVEPSVYPEKVIEENAFRDDKWRASHLRTFKFKLWGKIDQKDFIDNDGEYYKMAYDQAMMLPMLEMAGSKIKYVEEVLHIYNRATALNVDKIKAKEQFETMLRIREKPAYSRIF